MALKIHKVIAMQKMVDGLLIDLTDDEIAARSQPMSNEDISLMARAKRNELLAQSDVYALADRITDDWTAYRQALRDIPSQAGFPFSVTWPTKPE